MLDWMLSTRIIFAKGEEQESMWKITFTSKQFFYVRRKKGIKENSWRKDGYKQGMLRRGGSGRSLK